MLSQELQVRYDSRLKNAVTGAAESIKLIAKINSISPEAAAYINTIKELLSNNGIDAEWLTHQDTVTPGKSAAIRTNGETVEVRVNDGGVLKVLNVVEIYVPVNTKQNLTTQLFCMGPNHVKLIGHLNGRETEAIIMTHSTTIDLVNDLLAGTQRIVQPEITASTTFTAEIYEAGGNIVIPFTAEIYEPEPATFSAEIYNEE